MKNQTELQKVSEETMRFMRGRYILDEISNGKEELKFRRSGKTILTIFIREDRYDFMVIFGKAEREKFEQQRDSFPSMIQEIYDSSKTYHDGKWMMIPVADLEILEAVKGLIIIKKKPNRKPFPKDTAIYSDCGHRCDLCLHYTGGTICEEQRLELRERVERVYQAGLWGEDMMLCPGCHNKRPGELCHQKGCAADKNIEKCTDCVIYPCDEATVGLRGIIEARNMLADDVTWAILPFVRNQYGN